MEEIQKSMDDLEEQLLNENKLPKQIKITIILLSIFIVLLILIAIFIILYFNNRGKNQGNNENGKDNSDKSEEEYLLEINGFKEKWYDIYGNRTINISYLENDVIPNSYRKNKSNYIEELGDLNEGKDYTKHDVNVYDLYIPFSALSRKNKHNGIILFVHGGGLENNTKEETECFAVRFAKMGYITANMEYSNCLDKYKEKSFYRILDEISACIKSIKKELVSQNFDGSKLELALYGISSGGQLILSYGFSDKNRNEIIPIKFLMNAVGIATLDEKYWYYIAVPNKTLDNIESIEDIEKAKNNGTILKSNPYFLLHLMNLMTGKKLSQDDLNKLIINDIIQKEDEKYKQMYKFAKYGFPVERIGKNTIPLLCLYCGNDGLFVHYSYLRQKYINNGADNNISLVYMKYAGHERFHHGIERDIIAMKQMHVKMLEYAKTYFTNDLN